MDRDKPWGIPREELWIVGSLREYQFLRSAIFAICDFCDCDFNCDFRIADFFLRFEFFCDFYFAILLRFLRTPLEIPAITKLRFERAVKSQKSAMTIARTLSPGCILVRYPRDIF